MTITLLTQNDRPEIILANSGEPFAVVVEDTSVEAGEAFLQVGSAVGGVTPVTVTIPAWATGVEITLGGGSSLVLPAGVGSIRPEDFGLDADTREIRAYIRAISATQATRWKRRILLFQEAPLPQFQEIVVTGVPSYATSGIEGSTIAYTWPTASRADPSEQRLIRYFSAAKGGSPLASVAPPATVPTAHVGEWIELY